MESTKWTWPNVAAAGAEGAADVRLFDVHVEEVGEQANVVGPERAEQLDAVSNGFEAGGGAKLIPQGKPASPGFRLAFRHLGENSVRQPS